MIIIHMFHIFIQASWEEKLYSRLRAVLWFVKSLARLALARAGKTKTREVSEGVKSLSGTRTRIR